MVISGALHASRQGPNHKWLLGRIEAGEWFGEIDIFDPREAGATGRAAAASGVWSLSRSRLDAFVRGHPRAGLEVVRGIAAVISQRFRRLIDKLEGSEQTLQIQARL